MGREVVLFQSPVTEFERNRVTNYSEFDSILESTHLPYFNFNRGIQWPDEYFYDSNHLNQAGVEVFNAMFIDTLETHQLLK